jgi:cysteinyl-tRNA synthetase
MATIFKCVRKINRLLLEQSIDADGARRVVDAFREIDAVFHVCDFSGAYDDDSVQRMLAERDEARHRGDWKRADLLRDRLREMGVVVRDRKATPDS